VSEIIEDGVTGFISSTDIDQLALSLAKLIDDSRLRSTMAKAAAIRAQENFSVEKMVASHIQSYQQVIR
jgi:glycosyltransferase involved in cell wall biosynthesis